MIFLNLTKTITNENKFYSRVSWFKLIRPLTLSGTISTTLAGTAYAATEGNIKISLMIGFLIAAVFVQMAINLLNDYFDFINGQDQEKWIDATLDEGKSGPYHHQLPMVAIIFLVCAASIGLWLAFQSNAWIIFIGVLGIGFGTAYSAGKKSLAARGLGEMVGFIFLGFVPTILAFVIQGQILNKEIFAFAVPYALLISTMILSNNIRDIKKDEGFRLTLAMRLGRVRAAYLLFGILGVTYFLLIILAAMDITSWWTCIAFLATPFATRLIQSFRPTATRDEEIIGMKRAALHHWAFGMLFALGMWVSVIF
jgi:1,4-dihydroxy-2-naphthoate polyprenyltransferase